MRRDKVTASRIGHVLAAALLGGCGGAGSPVGSVVNSPGGGPSSPPTQLVNVKVTVTIPAQKHSKIHPHYVSVNTQSLVIQLASVDGNGVTGVNPTTINTDAHAKDCIVAGKGRVCTAKAWGSPGSDVFSVTTYSATNAAGSLLSVGHGSGENLG